VGFLIHTAVHTIRERVTGDLQPRFPVEEGLNERQ
jgi:hypothetical protein